MERLDSEIAAQNIYERQTEHGPDTRYTRPSPHYEGLYLWDSFLAAWINANAGVQAAEHGLPTAKRWIKAAQTELLATVEGQDENGFIPNIQNFQRTLDPERFLAFERGSKSSNYTQPPLLAFTALETYDAALRCADITGDIALADEARDFLHAIYPRARDLAAYFDTQLRNSPDDSLIGVYHPHATGRDSDPTFDGIKPLRLKRNGAETSKLVDKMNITIDYVSILWHGIKLRKTGGDVQKAREVYWMNDVMMNCTYADNLYYTAELAALNGNTDDSSHFARLAADVEQQILELMWNGHDRKFYALDADGDQIKETTVSNLFPVLLPHLREEQLESALDLLDASFDVPYPLPSVATDSPNYDPHNQESDRLWRGGTWINASKLVEYGLRKQTARSDTDLMHRPDLMWRAQAWADRIDQQSRILVKDVGLWEHYDPETGDAHRKRVKKFAWSNLGFIGLLGAEERLKQQRRLGLGYKEEESLAA